MLLVNINGESFKFSTGKYNKLQKAIIEEFALIFARRKSIDTALVILVLTDSSSCISEFALRQAK